MVNNCLKDPVLGTKIDVETGDVVEWCPSLLGKLLSPILGPEPENAGVNVFKVGLEKNWGAFPGGTGSSDVSSTLIRACVDCAAS